MTFRKVLSHTLCTLRNSVSVSQGLDVSDFKDVRPVGNARGAMITNKAGRAVFSAKYSGRKVKLYEAFSPGHAHFIEAVTKRLPEIFPEVIETRDGWVIAAWVEGQTADQLDVADHARLMRRLHETPLEGLPSSSFCYWSDFIAPRFLRAAALIGQHKDGEQLVDEVMSYAAIAPSRLSHPDLTASNVVSQFGGGLKLIDNELLCIGRLPLLDLCNSLRPMTKEGRDGVARSWFESRPCSQEEAEVTAKAWLAREVGSAFVQGKVERCERLIQIMDEDPVAELPFFRFLDDRLRESCGSGSSLDVKN